MVMRLLVLIATFWANLLPAQPALSPARTKADLIAVTANAVPGQEAIVALRFRCDPHYHIYWRNPGDAGEAPAWKWTTNADDGGRPLAFTAEAEWPAPRRIDLQGVINYAYEGETHLYLRAKVPADARGAFRLKAHVTWLECDDNGCYPQEADVSLTLPVGSSSARNLPADWERVPRETYTVKGTLNADKDTLRLTEKLSGRTLGTVLAPVNWFPQRAFVSSAVTLGPVAIADGPVHATAITTLSLRDAPEKLTDGPTRYIAEVKDNLTQRTRWVNVDIDLSGSEKETPTHTERGATDGTSAGNAPAQLDWQPWSPEAESAALAAGKTVYIDFTARWCATCQVNKRVYADPALQADFAKAGVVTLRADWTRKDPAITEELSRLGRQGIPVNVFRRRNAAPVILSELLTADQVREGLSASLTNRAMVPERQSPAGMLLLAFLGGALLNLMPCVFPVIGLKVLAFAGQAGSDRPAALRQSLAYALGVLASFLALGLLALALKSGWGAQMQSPLFVLLTTVLMVTMGMSLAGAFEIGTGLASTTAASSGNAGAFLSGVLATAVATPCTAPGLGAALGFALDPARSTAETLGFFAVIGLGMALPYVLLVAFPAFSRALPRPGEWMETLKQAMAFPLFGYALYLLWVLSALVEDAGWLRDASLGLVVIAACCWIWGRWGAPHRSDRERLWGRLIATMLYLATLAHLAYHLP
jgi:cytochrome c biogenesis protein CcdA